MKEKKKGKGTDALLGAPPHFPLSYHLIPHSLSLPLTLSVEAQSGLSLKKKKSLQLKKLLKLKDTKVSRKEGGR